MLQWLLPGTQAFTRERGRKNARPTSTLKAKNSTLGCMQRRGKLHVCMTKPAFLRSVYGTKKYQQLFMSLYSATHTALLLLDNFYLICSYCYRGICKVLTTVCDCRKETLPISLGPSMTRLPYFSFLIWRPLPEQSSSQQSEQGTPLPGTLAQFASRMLCLVLGCYKHSRSDL